MSEVDDLKGVIAENDRRISHLNEQILERDYDIEAYRTALQHIKRVMMVKVHEYSTEILKIESAINDPKSLFGRKETTA